MSDKTKDPEKPIPMRYPKSVVQRADAIAERLGESRNTVLRAASVLGLSILEQAQTDEELVMKMFSVKKNHK